MEFVAWDPEWETGNAVIDEEHKRILALTGSLLDAILDGTPQGESERALLFLTEYVEDHFRHEEEMMAARGYEALGEHREAHDRMRRELAALVQATIGSRDGRALTADLMDFLSLSLLKHIHTLDRAMAAHLRLVV